MIVVGCAIADAFSVDQLEGLFAAEALGIVADIAEKTVGIHCAAALAGIVALQEIPSRTTLAL